MKKFGLDVSDIVSIPKVKEFIIERLISLTTKGKIDEYFELVKICQGLGISYLKDLANALKP